MSIVDRRPLCEKCGERHYCAGCSGARTEATVIQDAMHAARLDVVEWLEKRSLASRRGVHATALERAARDLRKEHGL